MRKSFIGTTSLSSDESRVSEWCGLERQTVGAEETVQSARTARAAQQSLIQVWNASRHRAEYSQNLR